MTVACVVVLKVRTEPGPGAGTVLASMRVDFFVLHGPPEMLHDHVIHPSALPNHTDLHYRVLQHAGECSAGELRSLVRITDFRYPEGFDSVLKGFNTERVTHRVREVPAQDFAGNASPLSPPGT